MGQLLIHKSTTEVSPVIICELYATENNLCLFAYSKIHYFFPLIRLTLYPDRIIYFPASIKSECIHRAKFWPMWCKQRCEAFKKTLFRKSAIWVMTDLWYQKESHRLGWYKKESGGTCVPEYFSKLPRQM